MDSSRKECAMVRQVKRAKSPRLGRQDRWPSDYGVRDAEQNASKRGAGHPHAGGSASAKREGRDKSDRGSAVPAAAPSGDRQKR